MCSITSHNNITHARSYWHRRRSEGGSLQQVTEATLYKSHNTVAIMQFTQGLEVYCWERSEPTNARQSCVANPAQ